MKEYVYLEFSMYWHIKTTLIDMILDNYLHFTSTLRDKQTSVVFAGKG